MDITSTLALEKEGHIAGNATFQVQHLCTNLWGFFYTHTGETPMDKATSYNTAVALSGMLEYLFKVSLPIVIGSHIQTFLTPLLLEKSEFTDCEMPGNFSCQCAFPDSPIDTDND
jgi:hypothetical protein